MTRMHDHPPLELELKLEVDPRDLDMLRDHPLFAATCFVGRDQTSTYYDTPAHDLHAAGLSLRIRSIGGRHVQTVKAQSAAAAGLSARPEWESDVPDAAPELDDAASPIATLVDTATLRSLAPVFVARVTRRAALIEHDGASIEVVLDQGEIVAGERSAPVAEIELELRNGDPAALFSLARALGREVPLRLGVLTKSGRGYRLLDPGPALAVKRARDILSGDMTVATAFERVVAACLRHFRLNEAILVDRQDAEALHQARVALRRLRSALAIFRPVVEDDRFAHLRQELRWLAKPLGEARDIDVLLARGIDDQRLHAARDLAYAAVLRALESGRSRDLMVHLAEWASTGSWRGTRRASRAAERFAAKALDRLRRRVKRRGRHLAAISDDDRHQVRIDAKKLRYAAEFFAGLFTGGKTRRRTRAFLAALKALQAQLGDLNDLAAEPAVLARFGIEPRRCMPDGERAVLLARAEDAHDALCDARRFWK